VSSSHPIREEISRHILITGASSGLGAALAISMAAPGIRLSLTGRDNSRLSGIAATCSTLGAQTVTSVFDVTDPDAAKSCVDIADDAFPLDLVIANAGISAGTGRGGETAIQARAIFAVNVNGVANTILPTISKMRPRGHGQIAIMSSLAGFGRPPIAHRKQRSGCGENLCGANWPDQISVSRLSAPALSGRP